MKLFVRHAFSCTPQEYWDSYWDPAFEDELSGDGELRREVLSEQQEGPIRVRRMRFTSSAPLPFALRKALGRDTFEYEQVSRVDDAARRITWQIEPPVMPDKIRASGVLEVRATPSGCERVLDGEVRIDIPFVGSKLEQAIADAITKGHDKEAQVRSRWLKK